MARKTTAKSAKTASARKAPRTATKRPAKSAAKSAAKRTPARTAKRPAKKGTAKGKKTKVDPITLQVIGGALHTAAREMGIDRVEIRRRNMIPADAMPYQTGLTFKYDSGEFETIMDKALAMADWAGFEARRAEAKSRGKLRGIGFSCTIEQAGGRSMQEVAELRFEPSGSATLYIGTVSHGQGHDTIY